MIVAPYGLPTAEAGCVCAPLKTGRAPRVVLNSLVQAPFAYTHFCLRYSDDCRMHGAPPSRSAPLVLTDARWTDLVEVNARVNSAIIPRSYKGDTSFDTWRIGPQFGDCNDFAVTKRHELLARGWPSRAVLLSEVETAGGERHLVLLVRTAEQDYILDNLASVVKPWSEAPYTWIRVQSPSETLLWSMVRVTHASS